MNRENIKTFLVGGAVRDQILGVPVKDRDWVVVGATPQVMLDAGFKQVGKDFPVFLDPDTGEEFALARKERSTGGGYDAFEFDTDPSVTLEEDLKRRDLTMNSIAMDNDGNLIDPFGGVADIKNRIIRHTSDAFAEDPVRILRTARFVARYQHLGFTVDPSTLELMTSMVRDGAIDDLVKERVWQELDGALGEQTAFAFFQVLKNIKALNRISPVLNRFVAEADKLGNNFHWSWDASVPKHVRFAMLLNYISNCELERLKDELRMPNEFIELLATVVCTMGWIEGVSNCNAQEMLGLLKALDFRRNPSRMNEVLHVAQISRGLIHQVEVVKKLRHRVLDVNESEIAQTTEHKKDIAGNIESARMRRIHMLREEMQYRSIDQM